MYTRNTSTITTIINTEFYRHMQVLMRIYMFMRARMHHV